MLLLASSQCRWCLYVGPAACLRPSLNADCSCVGYGGHMNTPPPCIQPPSSPLRLPPPAPQAHGARQGPGRQAGRQSGGPGPAAHLPLLRRCRRRPGLNRPRRRAGCSSGSCRWRRMAGLAAARCQCRAGRCRPRPTAAAAAAGRHARRPGCGRVGQAAADAPGPGVCACVWGGRRRHVRAWY